MENTTTTTTTTPRHRRHRNTPGARARRRRAVRRQRIAVFTLALSLFVTGAAALGNVTAMEAEPTQIMDDFEMTNDTLDSTTDVPMLTWPQSIAAVDAMEAEAEVEPEPEPEWFTVEATAYCSCAKCCGDWATSRPDGVVYTADGSVARAGVTVAADWSVFPAGTVLYIEGLGERVVQDKGGAITGMDIDVYFNDHQAALQFGRQYLKAYVVSEGDANC